MSEIIFHQIFSINWSIIQSQHFCPVRESLCVQVCHMLRFTWSLLNGFVQAPQTITSWIILWEFALQAAAEQCSHWAELCDNDWIMVNTEHSVTSCSFLSSSVTGSSLFTGANHQNKNSFQSPDKIDVEQSLKNCFVVPLDNGRQGLQIFSSFNIW